MQILFESWLRNWDEAWYGEIIKNMAVNGHGWLMPYWNGQYYFDHPPLYFWLSGLVVKIFGLGEWQVRIVSILAGLGVVGLTYLLGKKLFNRRAGIGASLVLVSIAQVGVRFSHGNLDALMIFLFLLTFYLWLKGKIGLAGVSLRLGFLTKGWLLGLFPVAVIVIYRHKLSVKKLVGLIVIGILVFGLWVVPAGIRFGKPMMDRYVLGADAGHWRNPLQTWSGKFFEHGVRDLGLWIIPGLMMLAKKRRNILPLLMISFVFIVGMSFSDEKSDWYILPAYPLVALIIGYLVSRWNKMLVGVLVIAGLINAYRVEMIYPDRSRVGAELGRYAKRIIPERETVVLDDHDFTAFLFYADVGMVYVPSPTGGKSGEWWTLRYDQLPELVKEKREAWIVTADKSWLPREITKVEEIAQYGGYSFLKTSF